MLNEHTPPTEQLLLIDGLNVEYHIDRSVVHAVNGVSLSIGHGETLGLVGETGAGKTTIAKAIMQILPVPPARIAAGSIMLEGQNVITLSEKEKRKVRGKRVSMIFQDPMTALDPVVPVGQQIAECFRIHEKLPRMQAEKKAVDMLMKVGIPGERFNEYPHQFSGGMKQRVVIAMALACEPDLIIADEPTTALDVTIQAQVLNLMTTLKKEMGTAILLITHDLGIVAGMCDRVAVIYAGEIVEYADTAEVYDHTAHPYTRGLFDSLPSMNENARRLKPIQGLMPDPTALPEGCSFWPRCPYATDQCRKESPGLSELRPGHFVKCHHPLEVRP